MLLYYIILFIVIKNGYYITFVTSRSELFMKTDFVSTSFVLTN